MAIDQKTWLESNTVGHEHGLKASLKNNLYSPDKVKDKEGYDQGYFNGLINARTPKNAQSHHTYDEMGGRAERIMAKHQKGYANLHDKQARK
jgi:hypothetical protein